MLMNTLEKKNHININKSKNIGKNYKAFKKNLN